MGEVVEIQKKKQGEMDEYFIEHYMVHNNQTDAYIYAKRMLGIDDFKEEYAKQYGYSLFKKLRAEISERLDEAEVEDAALSRNVLRKLAVEAESESVQVTAAKELARKRIERPSVKKSKDVAELDAEIKSINEQLKEYSDGKD